LGFVCITSETQVDNYFKQGKIEEAMMVVEQMVATDSVYVAHVLVINMKPEKVKSYFLKAAFGSLEACNFDLALTYFMTLSLDVCSLYDSPEY
jgi:pentatricopeptide repeat protein